MPADITQRVLRYLTRHAATLAEAAKELGQLELISPEGVEEALKAHTRLTARLLALDEEQAALLKEWQPLRAAATEAERAAVRAAAEHAAALAEHLRTAVDTAQAGATQAAAAVALQANALRRSAGHARRFAHDSRDQGGFVDKQA